MHYNIQTSCTPHYENVPFEIPESWEWAIGYDIFRPMESTKPQGEFFDYIDIDAIDNDRNIVSSPKHLLCKDAPSRASRCVSNGDVLFSMVRPYLRNIAKVEIDDCIASTGFYVCKTNGAITCDYCFYMMISNYVVNGLNQFMKGDNSPSINNDNILSWLYPIPPLSEQQRIVLEIKRWFNLIDSLKDSKSELKDCVIKTKLKVLDLAIHGKLVPQDPCDESAIELLKRINPSIEPCDTSHYENIPKSWCITKLESICKSITSKKYQIKQSEIKESGKYPVISQSANFIEGYADIKDKLYSISAPLIIFGDHTRIVKYVDFDFIVGADGVKILQPLIYNKYFYYLTEYTSKQIENRGYGRHYSYLSQHKVPVPPFEEQKRIVFKLEEIFETIDKITA